MSLKKAALNGLAVFSLTLLASTTGWSMEDVHVEGRELMQRSMRLSSDLRGVFTEVTEASQKNCPVWLTLSAIGHSFEPEALSKKLSAALQKPSAGSVTSLLTLLFTNDDAFRTKIGITPKAEAFQCMQGLVGQEVESVASLNRQLRDRAEEESGTATGKRAFAPPQETRELFSELYSPVQKQIAAYTKEDLEALKTMDKTKITDALTQALNLANNLHKFIESGAPAAYEMSEDDISKGNDDINFFFSKLKPLIVKIQNEETLEGYVYPTTEEAAESRQEANDSLVGFIDTNKSMETDDMSPEAKPYWESMIEIANLDGGVVDYDKLLEATTSFLDALPTSPFLDEAASFGKLREIMDEVIQTRQPQTLEEFGKAIFDFISHTQSRFGGLSLKPVEPIVEIVDQTEEVKVEAEAKK